MMIGQTLVHRIGAVIVSVCAVMNAAQAQDTQSPLGISIELNSMVQNEGACRLIFMVESTLAADIDSAIFETVLFTKDGLVERLTLFDFQDVPAANTRVRQFELGGLTCDNLGRVLFNGVQTCTGENSDAGTCSENLKLTTRTDVEVLG